MRAFFILLTFGSASLLFASVGSIVDLAGKTALSRAQQTMDATLGLAVEQKDILTTSERSRVKIKFTDATIISIGQNSRFSISEYLTDDAPAADFTVTKGFFKALTGTIGKIAPDKFKIRTKNATIGIRGTTFIGEVYDTNSTIACTKGTIIVSTAKNSAEVDAGQMAVIRNDEINVTTLTDGKRDQLESDSGWYPYWEQNEIDKYYKNTAKTKSVDEDSDMQTDTASADTDPDTQEDGQSANDAEASSGDEAVTVFTQLDAIDDSIQEEIEKERTTESLPEIEDIPDETDIPSPPDLPGGDEPDITPPDFPSI